MASPYPVTAIENPSLVPQQVGRQSTSAKSVKHAVRGQSTVRFATNAHPWCHAVVGAGMGGTLLTLSSSHRDIGDKPFGMMETVEAETTASHRWTHEESGVDRGLQRGRKM